MRKPGRTRSGKTETGVAATGKSRAATVGGKSATTAKPAKAKSKATGKKTTAKAPRAARVRAGKTGELRFLPPPKPRQIAFKPLAKTTFGIVEVSSLERFEKAHEISRGEGVTVAVLDSGCFIGHRDFAPSDERIAATVDCTAEPPGADVSDTFGHGTHVAGALAASGVHLGVAPACRILPVKIMTTDSDTSGIGPAMARGLNWVLDNADTFNISAICLSVGDDWNHKDDSDFASNPIAQAIEALAARNIAVVTAAGNLYGKFSTENEAAEGMCFPAIVRRTISVGAVYDEPCSDADPDRLCSLGEEYGNPVTLSSRRDQLAIYSQRMERADSAGCGTTIFATGSWVTATGIQGEASSSIVQGTSEAAPIVAGVIALLQSLHLKQTGERRPDIDKLVRIIRDSAHPIDDDSSVTNRAITGKRFLRIDAFAAVQKLQQDLPVG